MRFSLILTATAVVFSQRIVVADGISPEWEPGMPANRGTAATS